MDSDSAVRDEEIFETSDISEKGIDPLTVPRLPTRILDCSREPSETGSFTHSRLLSSKHPLQKQFLVTNFVLLLIGMLEY